MRFLSEQVNGMELFHSHCLNELPLCNYIEDTAFFFGYKRVSIHHSIDQRRRLRMTLSEVPSLDDDGDDCGNGSSGSKGSISPIWLSFRTTSEDLRAMLFRIAKASAGKSNLPKKSPSTTLAKSSMLNVIEISISNHPSSCWKPYSKAMTVFR